MTNEEATKWAIDNLSELLSYQYYPEEKHAILAASAMTILSSTVWTVQHNEGKYWVVSTIEIDQYIPHRNITTS